MPKDLDASRDAAAAPRAQLQRIFDAPLLRAARQLIDLGAVSDVRVPQSGPSQLSSADLEALFAP
jgi:hypothetical protein